MSNAFSSLYVFVFPSSVSLQLHGPTIIHFIVVVPSHSRIAWRLRIETTLPFWSSPCFISPLNFIVGLFIMVSGCNTREWQIVNPWLIVELNTRSSPSVTIQPYLNKSIFVTVRWQKRQFYVTMFLEINSIEIIKLDIYHGNVWMNMCRVHINDL
jgi:hypothetical protein